MPTLKPGDPAPDFTLSDQHGNNVSLKDFQGRYLLIYFYPKADTPGCTTQACAVRDADAELKQRGVAVLGISPDAPDKQLKFDRKYNLGFPLLADTEHKVAEAYGVWGERSMYGRKFMGINRSSFLLDPKGKVVGAWYNVKPGDTVPKALAALDA